MPENITKKESQHIKKAGLKVTSPRVKILEMLENRSNAERHLTAEDVYKTLLQEGVEIGLATVYSVGHARNVCPAIDIRRGEFIRPYKNIFVPHP